MDMIDALWDDTLVREEKDEAVDLYKKYFPDCTDEEDRKCFLACTAGLHKTLRRARNKFLVRKRKLYQREIPYDLRTAEFPFIMQDYVADAELESKVLWLAIEQEMQCLSEQEKVIIRAHYKYDLTDREIAVRMGLSQSWVTRHRNIALQKLKTQLERDKNGFF